MTEIRSWIAERYPEQVDNFDTFIASLPPKKQTIEIATDWILENIQ